MDIKAEITTSCANPPLHLRIPSTPEDILSSLSPARFDVILINPLSLSSPSWSYISSLPVRQLCADPGFVFLWVGAGDSDGLERGRECFVKWGFRRAEDIVWVKTNKRGEDGGGYGDGLFASQKVHCLMGIRGTVRRSTDSRFVHCNVDTDVMVWEEGEPGERSEPHRITDSNDSTNPEKPTRSAAPPVPPTYPPYLYTLIENFCLGTRRLELFGDPTHCRRGWVTASLAPLPSDLSVSDGVEPFDPTTYTKQVYTDAETGRPILPFHAEVDSLRPQSPKRRPRQLPGQAGQQIRPSSQVQMNGGQFRPPRGQAGLGPGQGLGMDMGMGMGMGMPSPMGTPVAFGMGPMGMGGLGGMPNPMMLQQMQMAQMAQMQAQAQAQQLAQMQFARMHMAQMMGGVSPGQEQFLLQQQQQEYGQGQGQGQGQGWFGPNGWTQQ